MNTLKVCPNAFFSGAENYKVQTTNIGNNKGNALMLFPSIYDLLKNLILNLSETIGW